jgi:hypothetical protein
MRDGVQLKCIYWFLGSLFVGGRSAIEEQEQKEQ